MGVFFNIFFCFRRAYLIFGGVATCTTIGLLLIFNVLFVTELRRTAIIFTEDNFLPF